jgi:hypothetical protein
MKKNLSMATALAAISSPAYAEVKATSDSGFNVVHIDTVATTPEEIWKRLLLPKNWWNKAHSWSGSSEGFYIDPQANGCFCELFQEKAADGKVKTVGSVEHMRVLFVRPGKVLRMQGALGPLQSEAIIGTLTVAMEPLKDAGSTQVSFSYVVGGYMRYKIADIAPAIDKILGEQFRNMLEPFSRAEGKKTNIDEFSLDVNNLNEAKPDGDEQAALPNPETR